MLGHHMPSHTRSGALADDDNLCIPKSSATGTRTRVARVRAEYPNQLDYSGIYNHSMLVGPVEKFPCVLPMFLTQVGGQRISAASSREVLMSFGLQGGAQQVSF